MRAREQQKQQAFHFNRGTLQTGRLKAATSRTLSNPAPLRGFLELWEARLPHSHTDALKKLKIYTQRISLTVWQPDSCLSTLKDPSLAFPRICPSHRVKKNRKVIKDLIPPILPKSSKPLPPYIMPQFPKTQGSLPTSGAASNLWFHPQWEKSQELNFSQCKHLSLKGPKEDPLN